jgi:hypothetical protein
MILTKEFLEKAGACKGGYQVALENNLIGKPYDEVISYLYNNGFKDDADWLLDQKNTIIYIKESGNVIINGYRIQPFDIYSKIYNTVESLTEDYQNAKNKWIEENKYIISVDIAITDINGNETWKNIDLNSYIPIGNEKFKVFNTNKGSYETFSTIEDAKVKHNFFVQEFEQLINKAIYVEQGITSNENNEAWEKIDI